MSNSKIQYNINSPSIRRILREIKEMQNDKSTLFKAFPLEVRSYKSIPTLFSISYFQYVGCKYITIWIDDKQINFVLHFHAG
jgi:hypothetical protein